MTTTEQIVEQQLDARIQDVTARISGVDLKTTTRVLRALALAATALGEEAASEAVASLLRRSLVNGEGIDDLHAKPCTEMQERSEQVNKRLLKKVKVSALESLRRLDDCPYAAAAQVDEFIG